MFLLEQFLNGFTTFIMAIVLVIVMVMVSSVVAVVFMETVLIQNREKQVETG